MNMYLYPLIYMCLYIYVKMLLTMLKIREKGSCSEPQPHPTGRADFSFTINFQPIWAHVIYAHYWVYEAPRPQKKEKHD